MLLRIYIRTLHNFPKILTRMRSWFLPTSELRLAASSAFLPRPPSFGVPHGPSTTTLFSVGTSAFSLNPQGVPTVGLLRSAGLRAWQDLIARGKPLDVAALYASRSLYMDHGQVDVAFIRNDLAEYWQKWPFRHYRLISSPETVRANDGDYLIVRYRIAFDVQNRTKRISGEAEYMLGIFDSYKNPPVFAMKENILRRRVSNRLGR